MVQLQVQRPPAAARCQRPGKFVLKCVKSQFHKLPPFTINLFSELFKLANRNSFLETVLAQQHPVAIKFDLVVVAMAIQNVPTQVDAASSDSQRDEAHRTALDRKSDTSRQEEH